MKHLSGPALDCLNQYTEWCAVVLGDGPERNLAAFACYQAFCAALGRLAPGDATALRAEMLRQAPAQPTSSLR